MPSIQESIPAPFADKAEAARASFSAEQGSEFKLTGIVDPSEDAADELQLILCGTRDGQEACLRERFLVREIEGRFDVTHLAEPPPEIGSVAPRLDPPAGQRAGWLDAAIARHAFVVLVFYRGFW